MTNAKAQADGLALSSLSSRLTGSPSVFQQQVQDVVWHLERMMETTEQAIANPDIAHVRMTACRVTVVSASPASSQRGEAIFYSHHQIG